MNSELRDACLEAVQRADGPVTNAEIGLSANNGRKPGARLNKDIAGVLAGLCADSVIGEWPKYGSSRVFSKLPFRTSVEEAFIRALDEEALTISQAAKPVSKLLRRVSEPRALAELKIAAAPMASAKRILRVAVNRQSVVYLSWDYLGRMIPASPIGDSILAVVERLQSGPGNYVRIDHLRNAPELLNPVDRAAIELAEKGRLVLARYDGPRPVADEDKWRYIEDEHGDLFIGLAIRRVQ